MRHITDTEARAFRARWAAVRAAEAAELQATPMAHKMRQLIALMSSAKELGWGKSIAAEEAQVRRRWMQLRKAARG